MKNHWDQRFSAEEYVYGKNPNDYFRLHLDMLEPGNILLPGEGEGRNAVYAASRGWSVTAFDLSSAGREKSLRLSSEKGVHIRYDLAGYLDFDPDGLKFDCIGLFFTHQPGESRRQFHQKLIGMLKPGGVIILEGFHKNQITKNTGGPGNTEFLFSEEDLSDDFDGLKILEMRTLTRVLDEGPLHQGEADVVRMKAIRIEGKQF